MPPGNKAARIDAFLSSKNSPLAGYGKAFVRAGRKYGVDPFLMVAISGQESSFGTYGPSRKIYNAWGWGPHIKFKSWEESIDMVTRGLAKGYIREGRTTIPKISTKWAPVGAANDPTNLNSHWVKGVEKFYLELGGGKATGTVPSPAAAPRTLSQGVEESRVRLRRDMGLDASLDRLGQMADRSYDKRRGPVQHLSRLADAAEQAAAPLVSPSVRGAAAVSSFPAAAAPVPQANPQGAWQGAQELAQGLAVIGLGFGLKATSEKRGKRGTKSGNRSDHWTGSKDSYAYDLSNGGKPTQEMDRAAIAVARRLGVEYDGRGPLELRKTVGGYRYQVLYRTSTGGNHYNHLHIGVRRVK